MAPWSVVISAAPGPSSALTSWGTPGSLADSGIRSQFFPPSVLCSKMLGLPTIQPSSPLKSIELNLKLKPSSVAAATLLDSHVRPPSNVSSSVWRVPTRNPWSGSVPVKATSKKTTPSSTGTLIISQSEESKRFALADRVGVNSVEPAAAAPRSVACLSTSRRLAWPSASSDRSLCPAWACVATTVTDRVDRVDRVDPVDPVDTVDPFDTVDRLVESAALGPPSIWQGIIANPSKIGRSMREQHARE
mmetsp:Transcript_12093/g.34260  ORF Transcript_12093/g.34260 Transcript_12093/m.34260 type:complete len:247 (+) Transcript_12093:661-1401(+)